MLVPRTFKLVKNDAGETTKCFNCPLIALCKKYINQETGEIQNNLVSGLTTYSERVFVQGNAPLASSCKKAFPNYKIIETTPKEVYHVIDRAGNTVIEANSFGGMIGKYLLVILVAIIIIALIGLICSSIF